MSDAIGDEFQRLTKYHRGRLSGRVDFASQPAPYRTHPSAKKTISLPPPRTRGGPSLWQVLAARRSEREYAAGPIALAQLSQLLWAAQGVTARLGDDLLRTAPSAGALYPIETYVVVNDVDDLPPGLYHYDVRGAHLSLLKQADLRTQVARAALDQTMAAHAAAVFLWTAIVQRARWKYRQRCYRYIYLDAGHIGQNLHLAATALGLGCCAIGALFDDEVNALVGADGVEETVVYLSAVGRL